MVRFPLHCSLTTLETSRNLPILNHLLCCGIALQITHTCSLSLTSIEESTGSEPPYPLLHHAFGGSQLCAQALVLLRGLHICVCVCLFVSCAFVCSARNYEAMTQNQSDCLQLAHHHVDETHTHRSVLGRQLLHRCTAGCVHIRPQVSLQPVWLHHPAVLVGAW